MVLGAKKSSGSPGAAVRIEHFLAARAPDEIALQDADRLLSYGDLTLATTRVGERLAGMGIRSGDRVVNLITDGVEHIVAVFATLSVGAVTVPADPEMGRRRLERVLARVAPRLCLVAGDGPRYGQTPVARLHADADGWDVRRHGVDTPRQREAPVRSEGIAMIRFSSGSTGEPKGIVLPEKQLVWTANLLAEVFGLGAQHRELIIAPLFYSGAWQRVAATFAGGGRVVLAQRPVTVTGLLEDLEEYAATGFFTPPPLVHAMLKASTDRVRGALSRCRSIEIGSASIGAEDLAALMELAANARIFYHYGLSECSRAVILDVRAHPDKLDTVGEAAPGVEVEVRDGLGNPLGSDQAGQIFLRGPQLTTGFWRQPELDARHLIDGWLATHDYGRLDDRGFLSYLGRRDDLITCGGYSFFPQEVEAELGAIEGVLEYVVAGVKDPRGVLGTVPWVFAVPAVATGWSPQPLLTAARRRLPGHMVPRWVVQVAELPLTASGKPNRRSLVERYATSGEGAGGQD